MISLKAESKQVEDDQTVSADLFLHANTQSGQWLVYVEGNSSLSDNNVSTVYIESNADAGSALDPDRKGRVQISEFNYRFNNIKAGQLTLGLIDPSAYLDRSRITNDENIQFLAASFVNNPTIEFPDYTLGLAYEKPASASLPQINLVFSNSHGLADNPNLSYNQLIQRGNNQTGAFAALGLGWETSSRLIRLGFWINTQKHTSLENNIESNANNYGSYLVLGKSWGNHGINMRLGLANPDVSEGKAFSSLAYRFLWHDFAIGLGMAKTWLSPHAARTGTTGLNDFSQVEVFARRSISDNFHLSASVQRLTNSGFINLNNDPRKKGVIAGLRLHMAY